MNVYIVVLSIIRVETNKDRKDGVGETMHLPLFFSKCKLGYTQVTL